MIRFHVPRSPTTLEFHHFGNPISQHKVIRMFAHVALGVAPVAERSGTEAMTFGHFVYNQVNQEDRDVISLIVTDFREIGKPLLYDRLLDVVTGIPQFMITRDVSKELTFEVEVDGDEYVATGHIDYGPWSPDSNITAGLPMENAGPSSYRMGKSNFYVATE